MDVDALIQQTRNILESWGGASSFVESDGGYWITALPAAQGSEYQFIADIYIDGEVQIRAVRRNAPEGEYFWYKSCEEPDYDSLSSMHEEFLSELSALLTHKTRITHKRGILFGSFACEFRSGEEWENIGGTSYFRFGGFNTPLMKGRRRVYQSEEVLSET